MARKTLKLTSVCDHVADHGYARDYDILSPDWNTQPSVTLYIPDDSYRPIRLFNPHKENGPFGIASDPVVPGVHCVILDANGTVSGCIADTVEQGRKYLMRLRHWQNTDKAIGLTLRRVEVNDGRTFHLVSYSD